MAYMEAKASADIENHSRCKGVNIIEGQLLGESQFDDLRQQVQFDDSVFVALRDWNKAEKEGQKSTLFTDFLHI